MQPSFVHHKTLSANVLFLLITLPISIKAQEVSIEDFRIPETKYQRFLGGLSGGWNKLDQEYTGINNNNSNASSSSQAQMNLSYITNNFNEDYSFQLSLFAAGNASRNTSNSNEWYPSSTNSSSNDQHTYDFNFLPNVSFSKYIQPNAWYWYGEGNGDYSFQEYRYTDNSNNTNVVSYDSSYSKDNSWSASLGLGVGYGKMRDGYAVFGVLRILDKLEEDSLFVRSLTKEEILRLVKIFAKKDEYRYSQERYVKYFMDDLFAELQKMGVLKKNVPLTYSVARAIEVLSEQIEPRLFGWRVQLGVQKTFEENKLYTDGGYNNYIGRSYIWYSRNFIRLSSEFGHALSLNLHVHSLLSINVPDADYNRKIDFNFNVTGIYQIGERIDASLSYGFTRTHSISDFSQDIFFRYLNSEICASFRFFIENNISFIVSGGYISNEQQGYEFGLMKITNKAPRISFGVNYRFF